MLLIDTAHQRSSRRQHFIHEDEDRLLGRELYPLADDIDELAHGEVGGDQILLLVDGRDVGLLDLLADDGDAVGVLLTDAEGGMSVWECQGWKGTRRTHRSASALRFSKGCSSLNLDRMLTVISRCRL
jgi:hypothetical protein